MRRARTSTILARPWTVSVTIPACEPVSEIASAPRSWIAIAASAHEIRSPTEISMSSSRGFGLRETSYARRTRSSVVSPIAESTATTRLPASRAATIRRATSLIFCGSATDVPPNFITSVPVRGSARSSAGSASNSVVVVTSEVFLHFPAAAQCPSQRDLVGVLEVGAHGEAAGEARDTNAAAEAVGEVSRSRLAGHVRVRGEHDFLDPVAVDAAEQLVDPEVLRFDA